MSITTYRNDRTGETVGTELTRQQLVECFVATAHEKDWLWFWLAKHAQREKAKSPEVTQAVQGAASFIADSFLYSLGMGLKSPSIRVHHAGRRYKLYLSRKGTICLKSGDLLPGTNDPVGDEQYVGCVYRGDYIPNRDRPVNPADAEFIGKLCASPVEFLATCGRDMGRCTFCYKALEDVRSKAVGYGATCATRWGLPWGDKTHTENTPSFASAWLASPPDVRNGVRWLCRAIRENPADPLLWDVLSDALGEAGLDRRLKAPVAGVVIPSV